MESLPSCRLMLYKSFFSEKEKLLLENGEMKVSSFLYDTGVHALRLVNTRGELIFLPFQGQQIWDCTFDGRRLTMKSMFEKPFDTDNYFKTYGSFLLHCGATAIGNPAKEDTHPQHGELPLARYQIAYIIAGIDEKGRYIGIGGEYEHISAFRDHYIAEPFIKLYEDSAIISVSMSVMNLKHTDMELMYLMHFNFIPVDYSDILYSAKCDPMNVKTHMNLLPGLSDTEYAAKYAKYLCEMEKNPSMHNKLTPDLMFDPEICFTIKYLTDADGYAYTLQRHPDGYAHYVRHVPAELPLAIRWIVRNPDQEAMGMALPATSEHLGYIDSKKKGNYKILKPFEKIKFHGEAGLLKPEESNKVAEKIKAILEG